MKRLGFVGWRGMVGSVLLQRLLYEGDLRNVELLFFSTSSCGQLAPEIPGLPASILQNGYDLDSLGTLDFLITCQGSDYTQQIYPLLRHRGWHGYWIDSSSALRMKGDSAIVLDPVNHELIFSRLTQGVRTFVGGNCTVSLMLMALGGLFDHRVIDWISVSTYQAASGGGAAYMRELLDQVAMVTEGAVVNLQDHSASVLQVEQAITSRARSGSLQTEVCGAPLAFGLIPWIDIPFTGGQTREEWKGMVETQKILGLDAPIPIDGICVRIGALRCHSQALTIKLKRDIPISAIEEMVASHNQWVKVVPNQPEATRQILNPNTVSGTLSIPIGRLRKLAIGPEYLSAFTVGDQLLWGAAEPLRRTFKLLLEHG